MGQVIRCIILSLMVGICVKIYFETLLARRKWRHKWVEYTLLPVLTAGFMMIAFTEIPPYFLQPLRLILLLFVTAQIYFQVKPLQNFILSVLFCGVIWIVELVTVSLIYMLPWQDYLLPGLQEEAAYCILLCLVLLLHRRLKGRAYVLENTKWLRFGYFPIISMAAITAVGMISWNGDESQNRIFLIVTAGFGIMNLLAFYFIWEILVKEAKLRRFVIMQEKTRNQMELYRTMQSSFEQQKRFLHDYKNQLGCVQGLLADGKTEEASSYIAGLVGSLQKSGDYVNTNHPAVNVVLNRKYADALEKKITITMSVNDLSGLTMKEEDIVTLLVNLLDNAMEACEKLDTGRIIRLKMILEDGGLTLSVKNPFAGTLKRKGNIFLTTKEESAGHGIGLLNVNEVIRKCGGTCVVKEEDGWFCFYAVIPAAE